MSSSNSLQQRLVGEVVEVVVVRVVWRTAVEQGTGSTELNVSLGGILSCFTVGQGQASASHEKRQIKVKPPRSFNQRCFSTL